MVGCVRNLIVASAAALGFACVASAAAADPTTACAPAGEAWNRVAGSGDAGAMRGVIHTIPGVCTSLLAKAHARLAAAEAGARHAARIEHEREEAPAAAPPSEYASLSDILDRITNELIAQGPVAFEGFAHDSDPAPGKVSDWTYTKRMEYTAFTNDLSDCQLNFHFKLIVNGDTSDDKDAGVPLRILTAIKVAPEVDLLKIRDAQAGHPTYSSRLQPQIYDIDLIRNNGGTNEFSFYDEEAARRVARLFELAAERCGVTSISHY
jgi:hypothetical protein